MYILDIVLIVWSEIINSVHTGQCTHEPVVRSDAEGHLADLEEGWQQIRASQPTGKEMLG